MRDGTLFLVADEPASLFPFRSPSDGAPFAQACRRQLDRCRVLANAHPASVYRLYMHRLDRLKSAVADIRAHPEVKLHAALSVLLSKLVFQLAALLHQIFCLPKGGILAHQSVSSQSGSPFDSRCH